MYPFLVLLHVISAIVAVGPLFMIIPYVRHIQRGANVSYEQMKLPIRQAVTIVMHGGHLVVTTGVLLVIFGPWPWHTPWIVATVLVMLSSSYFLATAYRRQWRAYEEQTVTFSKLLRTLQLSTILYIAIMLIMLTLMVVKPSISI